jgi:PhoPQ-activated pathogenicity-related protein
MKKSAKISEIFSKYTGLRHCSISDNSGEEFYHTKLNQLFYDTLQEGNTLEIILDGNRGYSPSFIDESFGNLVYDFTLEKVKQNLEIVSNDIPMWKDSIITKTYPLWENRRKSKDFPKKTINHDDWWVFIDNKFTKTNTPK